MVDGVKKGEEEKLNARGKKKTDRNFAAFYPCLEKKERKGKREKPCVFPISS